MHSQNHSNSSTPTYKINNHNLSSILKKWQAFIEQTKKPNQIATKMQNYLQCPISSPTSAFSPKIKHIATHSLGPTLKERQVIRQKYLIRNKKKTLHIEDLDENDIRNSAHSLQMLKEKSLASQKISKTLTPKKKSVSKLGQNSIMLKEKRHKSLPAQKNQIQTLANNEYIKKILTKFQKHSQAMKQQNCVTFVKSNQPTDFRKYNKEQCTKFDQKNPFSVNKYKRYISTKIKARMQSSVKTSSQIQKNNPKRSIQISPWQILQEQA